MPPDATTQPDLVIRGALLIDGSGNPGVRGDLAVTDDRIVAMGDLSRMKSSREIKANGLALAPGFVDTHTHDDRALLSDPLMECKISQGVTTVITGNCGISLAPLSIDRYPPPPLDIIAREPTQFFATFDDYLSALDRDPPALNAACQVGHTTLRAGAMDRFDRAATQSEIDAMRGALETSLENGAIGMSTGLYYPPAKDAPTEEVIALAKPMRAYGGIHTTHMRDEASHLVQSVNETIEIGKASGIPVVISHHKASGTPNHGLVRDTLKLIDEARKTQRLGLDVYPYVAASTMLDPRRIPLASKIIVTWSKSHPEFAGQTLDAIAAKSQMRPDRGGEPAAAGRRHLLHDERGRCAPCAVIPAHHDRLRRSAARPASAPAAVGHIPTRARPLRARREAVPAGGSSAANDRAAGGTVRAQRPGPIAPRRLRRFSTI